MPATEKAPRGRGCRRIAIWLFLLPAVVAGTLGALLASGIPQRSLLERLLGAQLKARVDVGAVSLANPFTIQSLALTDAAATLYAPLLQVDSLSARYRWQPDAPRHIETITLTGVQIAAQGGPEGANYQFLQDLLAAPSESTWDPTPWIPEQVLINDLWAEARFPGYYLRLDNLAASAALYSLDSGTVWLGSPALAMAWDSVLTPGPPRSHVGALALDVAWSGRDVNAEAHVDFGDLAQMDGSMALSIRDGAPYLDVTVPALRLDDPLWSAMLMEHLPTPVRFGAVSLSNLRLGIHALQSGARVEAAELDGQVSDVTIGPPESPYYDGPLGVALHGNYGDTTTVEGTITLSGDQALSGQVTLDGDAVTATFDVPPWPRDLVAALLPEAYAATLAAFPPLDRLGAAGTVRYGAGSLDLEARLAAGFAGAEPLSIPLALSLAPGPGGGGLTLNSALKLGDATVTITVDGPADSPLNVANRLHNVSLNHWTETLMGQAFVPELAGALSGDVGITVDGDKPLGIQVNLTGARMGYDTWMLPDSAPLKVAGDLQYDLDAGRVASRRLTFTQEGSIDLTAGPSRLDLESGALAAALETALSLDVLGDVFELDGLSGSATLAGGLAIGAGSVGFADFTAESDDLYYGDWGVPFGAPLTLAGSLTYAADAYTLTFAPIDARLGAGTQLTAGDLSFQFPNGDTPFHMRAAPFALASDMEVLVRLGYIRSVENGRAHLTADALAWSGDSFSGRTSWDVTADRLVLADDMADLQNLATTGSYNPGDDEDGGGRITADAATIYSVPFGMVDTAVTVDAEQVACQGLTTDFLSGKLQLDASFNYRDASWPIVADMRLEGVDLAEFTRIFQPPDVILTGVVQGTATMAMTLDGLTALDVDLVATEDLSLNRSMVRQILMSQYVNDAVGSKSVQRIIERVIGNSEQRAFDKAILDLELRDGLIVGIARLESASLDVTVDIRAEPQALLRALRSADMARP